MVQVTVYNGEKYDRSQWRYVIFGTIFTLIIILSLLFQNWSGVIVMFFFLGGYLFYQVIHLQQITMEIKDEFLRIGNVTYSRSNLQGFVLEVHAKTGTVKNIVLLMDNQHMIYTFADDMDIAKNFVLALQDRIPMLERYQQTFVERFTRKIQL